MNRFAAAACSILSGGLALVVSSDAVAQTTEHGQTGTSDHLSPEPRDVLTTNEAAVLLRVEREVLLKLAETRQLPGRLLGDQWRFSRAALLGWLAGYRQGLTAADSKLAMRLPEPDPLTANRPLDAQGAAAIVGRGLGAAAQSTQQTEPPPATEPIGNAPRGRTASEVFLRDQRVLLAPNELTIDFGLFYDRNDDLTIGDLGAGPTLGLVETDTLGAAIVGRYSIGQDTELFASTSYRNRQVAIIANGLPFADNSRGDFGDLRLGARRTILNEGPGRPDIIVMVEGGIPLGASSYSLGGGVTLVKSFDPSVLYGSVNYRHTFTREFDDITRLQPRDRIDAEVGYAFALNDTIILNTAFSGAFSLKSSFENAIFRQNEIFSLRTGLTARITRQLFVQPSVSYRLNGVGNGFVLGLNFPYTFGR